MTAALHRDLAAVYERHGVTDMARGHWAIADAMDRVAAADAAAEAAIGSIPVTGAEVDTPPEPCSHPTWGTSPGSGTRECAGCGLVEPLPVEDMIGIYGPDWTGGLSSEDWVRRQRERPT